ncbi:hypothetical protein phytr_270 [Candidatus Phycorickettsia trachydisci]|uniref:Uncharacterized protein n=1 Tax=Candidatus Phycorickettsia trachydisci TaxID=2115978 RepID=A0A2P1P6U7_9RICK|nr:hypothetical protein [Candidatus Phycorickettsia trachydisci]AVP86990.1 hypothetical protein phytr_270 [Candidatus Phycorickettsia trachydisci]
MAKTDKGNRSINQINEYIENPTQTLVRVREGEMEQGTNGNARISFRENVPYAASASSSIISNPFDNTSNLKRSLESEGATQKSKKAKYNLGSGASSHSANFANAVSGSSNGKSFRAVDGVINRHFSDDEASNYSDYMKMSDDEDGNFVVKSSSKGEKLSLKKRKSDSLKGKIPEVLEGNWQVEVQSLYDKASLLGTRPESYTKRLKLYNDALFCIEASGEKHGLKKWLQQISESKAWLLRDMGKEEYNKGNFKRAEKSFIEAYETPVELKKNEKESFLAFARNAKIMSLVEEGKIDEAIMDLATTPIQKLRVVKKEEAFYYQECKQYTAASWSQRLLSEQKYKQVAELYFSSSLTIDNPIIKLYVDGINLAHQKDYDSAITKFHEALEKPKNLSLEGKQLLKEGKYEEAFKKFEWTYDFLSNDSKQELVSALTNAGMDAANKQKYDIASKCFSKVHELSEKSSDDTESFLEKLKCDKSQNGVQEIIDEFHEAINKLQNSNVDKDLYIKDLKNLIEVLEQKSCESSKIAKCYKSLGELTGDTKYHKLAFKNFKKVDNIEDVREDFKSVAQILATKASADGNNKTVVKYLSKVYDCDPSHEVHLELVKAKIKLLNEAQDVHMETLQEIIAELKGIETNKDSEVASLANLIESLRHKGYTHEQVAQCYENLYDLTSDEIYQILASTNLTMHKAKSLLNMEDNASNSPSTSSTIVEDNTGYADLGYSSNQEVDEVEVAQIGESGVTTYIV